MVNNVIQLPKRKEKEFSEDRLVIIELDNGWVEYRLADVYFLDDKPFGHVDTCTLLKIDPVRARQIDDPEVIRDVVRQKLKNLKYEIEQALIAVDKPIVTFQEEDDDEQD
jgi:hypothetical protein